MSDADTEMAKIWSEIRKYEPYRKYAMSIQPSCHNCYTKQVQLTSHTLTAKTILSVGIASTNSRRNSVTDFEYWIRKVNTVIADGGVDGDASVSDLVLAIRSDDSLPKWEKEALIHKLWEAF